MDFIEELFGLSPDGGNGATEALILIGIVLAVFAVGLALRRPLLHSITEFFGRFRKRKGSNRSDS